MDTKEKKKKPTQKSRLIKRKAAGGVQPVPETILKSRKRGLKFSRLLNKKNQIRRASRIQKTKKFFIRAEKYVQEYRKKKLQKIELKRQARREGNFYVEPESKLAFVVRIRGINGLHPKPRKILKLLRLLQINNGVFVKLNKASINMLRRVEPYIAYGYPNLKTIRQLLYKRGCAKMFKQRHSITDNAMIEMALKKYNVVCIEDIIHENFYSWKKI